MKLKRLIILAIVLSLFTMVLIAADDIWDSYKAKPLKVTINGQLAKPNSLMLINGSKMLDINTISDSYKAIVKYNDTLETLEIYKPNVHLSLSQKPKNSDPIVFGGVSQGNTYTFNILTQIDNLTTDISHFKYVIEAPAPNGKVAFEKEYALLEQREAFNHAIEVSKLHFEYAGKYKLKFLMKTDANAPYHVVAEKIILSQ